MGVRLAVLDLLSELLPEFDLLSEADLDSEGVEEPGPETLLEGVLEFDALGLGKPKVPS